MPDVLAPSGSHRVSLNGDKVTIHDLELFVGYDPEIDDADSDAVDLDEDEISRILERTKTMAARGQRPKLILGHNSDSDSGGEQRPVVGDVISLKMAKIGLGPGILGDIEMAVSDFDQYVKTNRYPRRSVEIWPDGYMSEVALLSSQTPARPLPDTRFARIKPDDRPKMYSRTFGPMTFAFESVPGPMNVRPPTFGDDDMEDETTRDEEATLGTIMQEIEGLKDENKKIRAALGLSDEDAEDDREDYMYDEKAENKKQRTDRDANTSRDDDSTDSGDPSTSSRIRRLERENAELKTSYQKLEAGRKSDKYAMILDGMVAEGYMAAFDDRESMLEELLASSDPAAKVTFWKRNLRKEPVNNAPLNLRQTRVEGGPSQAQLDEARKYARENSTPGDSKSYTKILGEQLAKIGLPG